MLDRHEKSHAESDASGGGFVHSPGQGQRTTLTVDIVPRPDFSPSDYLLVASPEISEHQPSQNQAHLISDSEPSKESATKVSQEAIAKSQDFSVQALPRDTIIQQFLNTPNSPSQLNAPAHHSPVPECHGPTHDHPACRVAEAGALGNPECLLQEEPTQNAQGAGPQTAAGSDSDIPSHQLDASHPAKPQSADS